MARAIIIFKLTIILIFYSKQVNASSCCGQAPSSFSVLTNNEKLNISTSFVKIRTQGRLIRNSGNFYDWSNKKRTIQSFTFDISLSLEERHQINLSSSLNSGSFSSEFEKATSNNLSDTLISYTYELLPEYSYSKFKPQVFSSVFLSVPSGHSIYKKNGLSEGTSVTGHEQWGVGLGLTLRKVYFPFSFLAQIKSIRFFSKNFDNFSVSDFFDTSINFTTSYTTKFFNIIINSGLTLSHISPKKINTLRIKSLESISTGLFFGVQKNISIDTSIGIIYTDQTLLGPAKNTLLNRSMSLNINHKFL